MIPRIRARRRQRLLLALLAEPSGVGFVQLAHLAQIGGLAVASHLDRLEADGWVARHRTHSVNGPVRVYRLTADGLAGARRELGLTDGQVSG